MWIGDLQDADPFGDEKRGCVFTSGQPIVLRRRRREQMIAQAAVYSVMMGLDGHW